MASLSRIFGALAIFAAASGPGFAQNALSSPTSTICWLVNFRFCDQGASAAAAPQDAGSAYAMPPEHVIEPSPASIDKKASTHRKASSKLAKSKPATPTTGELRN
jgi:hypothetical protein